MRYRRSFAALGAVAAAFALAGGATAGGGSKTVKLGDNFFKPKRTSVPDDTKVRFKWIGTNQHNVVKKRGPGRDFASETTDDPGVNYVKRFKKPGKYKIICTIHADEMRLKLKVG